MNLESQSSKFLRDWNLRNLESRSPKSNQFLSSREVGTPVTWNPNPPSSSGIGTSGTWEFQVPEGLGSEKNLGPLELRVSIPKAQTSLQVPLGPLELGVSIPKTQATPKQQKDAEVRTLRKLKTRHVVANSDTASKFTAKRG